MIAVPLSQRVLARTRDLKTRNDNGITHMGEKHIGALSVFIGELRVASVRSMSRTCTNSQSVRVSLTARFQKAFSLSLFSLSPAPSTARHQRIPYGFSLSTYIRGTISRGEGRRRREGEKTALTRFECAPSMVPESIYNGYRDKIALELS